MTFPDAAAPDSPVLLLRAAGAWHRVSGLAGGELAECPPVAPVPLAPPWLAGVAVHKGEALALVDLDAALDDREARAPDRRSRMLVFRGGGFAMAFLVQGVEGAGARVDSAPLDLAALARRLLVAPDAGGAIG